MEKLLHYVWKHRLFPLQALATTDGREIEVLDPGLHNTHAGPDFFNAKVRIGGTLWVGNVEIHDRSSDWFAHRHQLDPHYDNVVLHVAGTVDCDVITHNGGKPPQLQLGIPPHIARGYGSLLRDDDRPPCRSVVASLPRIAAHSWLSALHVERLAAKAVDIESRAKAAAGSWEQAFFVTLARNFGFGVNADAFELWARNVPLGSVAHHRDNAFQVEAMFMGQAGLLNADALQPRHRAAALADDYYRRLAAEYGYLSRKFSLHPIDHGVWRFMRLRPQNFPTIRIAQLARLYCSRQATLGALADCRTADDVRRMFATGVEGYWRTHYTFGSESREGDKRLSAASLNVLAVNTAVPVLYAYGRHRSDEAMCRRALDIMGQLPPEDNAVVRQWRECGLEAQHAADTQALIQLSRRYCERRDCLRCRFGYEYLRRRGPQD